MKINNMDFWNKSFENKKISLELFNDIFDKKITIMDKYNMNGCDWHMNFELIENNKYIEVTEQDVNSNKSNKTKCEFIPICDESDSNLLILIEIGSSGPYTWMIKKLENESFEVWVGGQGGAMNFDMNFPKINKFK